MWWWKKKTPEEELPVGLLHFGPIKRNEPDYQATIRKARRERFIKSINKLLNRLLFWKK